MRRRAARRVRAWASGGCAAQGESPPLPREARAVCAQCRAPPRRRRRRRCRGHWPTPPRALAAWRGRCVRGTEPPVQPSAGPGTRTSAPWPRCRRPRRSRQRELTPATGPRGGQGGSRRGRGRPMSGVQGQGRSGARRLPCPASHLPETAVKVLESDRQLPRGHPPLQRHLRHRAQHTARARARHVQQPVSGVGLSRPARGREAETQTAAVVRG